MIRLENVVKISLQDILKMSWRRLQNVLKTSWRFLEDVFARRLEDDLKTSWRCLEDVLKTSSKRLEDVFARRLEDVFRTSWKHLEDVFKTSWRCLEDIWPRRIYWSWPRRLEDVFWWCKAKANILVMMSSSRRMFAGFAATNVSSAPKYVHLQGRSLKFIMWLLGKI